MSKNSFIFLCLIFITFTEGALTAGAQTKAMQAFSLADSVHKANPANYRAPLDALRKIKPSAADEQEKSLYNQAMMTYQSFIGNYDSALYYADKSFYPKLEQVKNGRSDSSFVKENYFRNALTVLPGKLEPHRVVMLNEAHHIPAHRTFAIALLDELYKQGFRHLALETLSAKDSVQINKRRYPNQESGFYQREPLFGELMRQALKKGFTLIAYESEQECKPIEGKDPYYCNRFRDSIQAQNLARWVKKNPGKKLFVYAGYSHINESTENEWIYMAEFFKKFTGINPYTIDQVQMSERSVPKVEDPRYRALTDMKNIQAPMVAYVEDTVWSHSKQVDVTVFHPRYLNKKGSLPRYQIKNNRPDFYLLHNQRRPLMVTQQPEQKNFASEVLPDGTRMIMAFYQKEEGNRIPADVVELKKGQTDTILFLYPGAYDVVYLNERGERIMSRPMVIR